jgi:hypothetical protein
MTYPLCYSFLLISNQFCNGGGGVEQWALVHKTTYAPMIYTSPYLMIFDAGRSITWASGRGLGPGSFEFFGPQMALAYRLEAISQGPKNSRFSGPNPLLLALVMDAARI